MQLVEVVDVIVEQRDPNKPTGVLKRIVLLFSWLARATAWTAGLGS